MKKFLLLIVIVMFVGFASDTFGQRYNDRGDRRRIRRGIRSGQITRDEARDLRARQLQVRQARRAARSDGTLTRDERRALRHDERGHDRQIRQARRDDDRRNLRRGNGYYRRGAGSPSHPVFGRRNRN